MIRGIGLDVINVSRIRRWQKDPHLLERFFHPKELRLCQARGSQAPLHLAARFAAKEALGKALGTGLKGFRLRQLYVMNDENGKPYFCFEPEAEAEFNRRGGGKIFLSLTHEHDYAMAMVVLEEKE